MPTEINIPWKVIAASPDMMDVTYDNRHFPYTWRSSLAISVFEPAVDDLPTPLCGQKITLVKVTCSLTGYQPSASKANPITFGNEPLENLERLVGEYLGCYGALLNVAFFPPDRPTFSNGQPNLTNYPHILDFTPKSRELVRSITEGGELLTGSTRGIEIDQSLTSTEKNETTVGLEAGYEAGGLKATGKISHTWGTTNENKRGLSIDSGDTRQEKRSYTTSMDQLYSLLTGYHSGTNRATFIVLARPGTLQPTNRRTFAPGLRILEGVQDFIFIVSRPAEQDRLCIEATLNTGHYPEEVSIVGEESPVARRTFRFTVRATVQGGSEGFFSTQGETVEFGTAARPQDTFTLPEDWVLDTDAPGTEHGISSGEDRTHIDPDWGDGIIANHYDLRARRVDNRTVQAYGLVIARGGHDFTAGPDTIVDKDFIIHAKRPGPVRVEPTADLAQMLVTTRGLSVCFQSVDGCPVVFEPAQAVIPDSQLNWVEDLNVLHFKVGMSREQIYSSIRSALVAGTAVSSLGETKRGFTDTDYFSRKVGRSIPRTISEVPISQVVNLQKYGKSRSLLNDLNVGQVLSTAMRTFTQRLSLGEEEALELRRTVLQYTERRLRGDVSKDDCVA